VEVKRFRHPSNECRSESTGDQSREAHPSRDKIEVLLDAVFGSGVAGCREHRRMGQAANQQPLSRNGKYACGMRKKIISGKNNSIEVQ
jgi:hypothetical protein